MNAVIEVVQCFFDHLAMLPDGRFVARRYQFEHRDQAILADVPDGDFPLAVVVEIFILSVSESRFRLRLQQRRSTGTTFILGS